MKTPILSLAIALALGTLAACDRNSTSTPPGTSATPSPSAPAGAGSSPTPSASANTGTPGQADKKDGTTPPVQGQVDSKDSVQKKDFEQKGDGAGPKPGG